MNGMIEYIGLCAVLLWLVFRLLRLFAIRENAFPLAVVALLLAFLGWPGNPVLSALMAISAPFGVLLPALALRGMARSLGLRPTRFHWGELLGFAVAQTMLITSAAGLIPFDLYAWGYTPLGASLLALLACLLGWLRNAVFLPLVALLSTTLWVAGWASSNAFDNFSHLFLLPVVLVALIQRLITVRRDG